MLTPYQICKYFLPFHRLPFQVISGFLCWVHYSNCGDDITGVYICQNLSNFTLYVQFYACQLYLNRAVLGNST